MMQSVQPKTPDAVLQSLTQFGAAAGAKKMMNWEFKHAKAALDSGIYVTLYNQEREHECTRIGKWSRCFCNHLYGHHKLQILKNKRFGKNPCGQDGCKCSNYLYMFRRPEEIGQGYLPRRKGFDINEWRPLCKCKHSHAVHGPLKKRCSSCKCSKFIGDFCCLACDGMWEEHVVLYECEDDRVELGKPVGQDFYPLADVPDIQMEFLRQLEEGGPTDNLPDATIAPPAWGEIVAVGGAGSVEALEKRLACVEVSPGHAVLMAAPTKKDQYSPAFQNKPEKSIRLMRERGMLNRKQKQ